jgi:hypothetical protein
MVRKLVTMMAAAALATAPTMAQTAPPVADTPAARASAQTDDESELRGSTAPVFIGLLLVVILLCIVVCSKNNEPSNSP